MYKVIILSVVLSLSLLSCSSGRIDDVNPWYRVIKFSVDKIQSVKKDNKINNLQG
jgi:hypothetical protein